ncbi:MAG: DivIVA domain-containing protein [Cecembia sp.]
MKLTPSDIRDKSFEKNFRGYDKDEVTEFLKSLAEEYDLLLHEKNELEKRLEAVEKEAKKLKDVEGSLFRTLKTAEDTGAAIIEEAKKAAEDMLKTSQQKADSMVKAAKTQAEKMVEEAESKVDETLEALKINIKSAVRDYESLVNNRLFVIQNLKRITRDLDETIDKAEGGVEMPSLDTIKGLLENLDKNQVSKLSYSTKESPKPKVEAAAVAPETPAKEEEIDITDEKTGETENETTAEDTAGNTTQKVESAVPTAEQEHLQKEVREQDENEDKNQKNKKEGSFFDQLD